jgi:hypothetical protein
LSKGGLEVFGEMPRIEQGSREPLIRQLLLDCGVYSSFLSIAHNSFEL